MKLRTGHQVGDLISYKTLGGRRDAGLVISIRECSGFEVLTVCGTIGVFHIDTLNDHIGLRTESANRP